MFVVESVAELMSGGGESTSLPVKQTGFKCWDNAQKT